MKRTVSVATIGVADDYRRSVVPLLIQSLGFQILWTKPSKADLLIFGPFFNINRLFNKKRFIPKPIRAYILKLAEIVQRSSSPVTLFQTGENFRHNYIRTDYSISFDLAVDKQSHFRFPYWMELLDWSHEGIRGNLNPRYGELIRIERMRQPLGNFFLKKPYRAALFASHLNEPRETLFNVLNKHISVIGFGAHFDSKITNHSSSGMQKRDVLRDFCFNLCPENSLYPGYYTEKIPEAFVSDCLGITWTDANLSIDFNPKAVLNLQPMMHSNFSEIQETFKDIRNFEKYQDEKLLIHEPSLEEFKKFIQNMVLTSIS